MIKVVVCGACGNMGKEVSKTVLKNPDFYLVGIVDVRDIGKPLSKLVGEDLVSDQKLFVTDDLEGCLNSTSPDVMVDFTHPDAVMQNVVTALNKKVNVVIGTTGIGKEDLNEIKFLAEKNNVGAVVAPNFSIGAVLMMKFSELAAKYFKTAEIIELHHDKKKDAPSGTALLTAEKIGKHLAEVKREEKEIVEGVRGGKASGINIHSVRLPGLLAHQAVIFGSSGQTLTIKHDTTGRTSFMPGVELAIKEVLKRPGLTYGLENLLGI